MTATRSDPALLDAFRKQVRFLKASGKMTPYAALLVWKDQPGISQDDMIGILKDEGCEDG
jgi:hypothetical protein